MKTYVVICETMNRAIWLMRYAVSCFGSKVIKCARRHPMLCIETHDGVKIYFTCERLWFRGGQRLGRHHLEPVREYAFESMLDRWKEETNVKTE
jgi:hypothetical protein